MPTLDKILDQSSELPSVAREWLNLLLGDWQLIADVAFSDLLLYIPTDTGYVVAAQTRPNTAATLFETDLVGASLDLEFEEIIQALSVTHEIIATESDDAIDTWVPVRCEKKIVAVLRVVSASVPDRVPSAAHEDYEKVAELLIGMVADGSFPVDGAPSSYRHGTPRVSDGVVFMDSEGVVLYASPNAVSNFHKYGVNTSLTGNVLAEVIAESFDEAFVPDEALPVVLLGKAAWLVELESQDIVLTLRAVPLSDGGERVGALLMCRDVTRMRRSERELMSKDATIKEINHRVKNNLQTVSALLRMQARRAASEETRIALLAAQRRVEMIAIVHERLSQTIDEVVDFDDVFGSLLRTVRDVAVTDSAVEIEMHGSFGRVRAEQATALAVVLNEIISNSVEHGLAEGGRIDITVERNDTDLVVDVRDNGEGMAGKVPTPGVSSLSTPTHKRSGLGTQIVRTLVASELRGSITWENAEPHGTIVHVKAKLRS